MIPLQNSPFDRSRFQRRLVIDWEGKKIYFSSAEDTILIKLKWSLEFQSEKQIEDARGIIEIQGDRLDWPYLDQWAFQLGIQPLLDKIRENQS